MKAALPSIAAAAIAVELIAGVHGARAADQSASRREHRTAPPPQRVESPELADDIFFAALIDGDTQRLDCLLAEDFVIIDVLSGTAIDRRSFTAAVGDRIVTFTSIDVAERTARRYRDVAIIVGRTAISGMFEDTAFSVASRYTHVFVHRGNERWVLASAQGTPITATS
jgi:ketosteroid isomerase-like protein